MVVLLNHVEWQNQVVNLATTLGWKHLHVRRAVGRGRKWVTATNIAWPDLTLWHPKRGGLIVAELKIPPDVLSPDQREVLDSLEAAGIPAYVWTPYDLDEVTLVLTQPVASR